MGEFGVNFGDIPTRISDQMSGIMAYDASCADGEVLTGMDLVANMYNVGQINNIVCRPPNRLADTSYGGDTKHVGVGSAPGASVSFRCPVGYAFTGMQYSSDGTMMRNFKPICTNLQTGQSMSQGSFGNNGSNYGAPKVVNGGSNTWATGIYGQTGAAITSMNLHTQSYLPARNALYTPSGQADCCMGLNDSSMCSMSPQTQQCDQFMTAWCQKNTKDPRCSCILSEMTCPNKFDINCIKNNGYHTADMKNTPCPSIMNCTQFQALSPGAQELATNVEQNCSTTTIASSSASGGTTTSGGTSTNMILIIVFLLLVVSVALMIGYYKLKAPTPNHY
jgi:hypothetical protein